jgi:hypothetical protein
MRAEFAERALYLLPGLPGETFFSPQDAFEPLNGRQKLDGFRLAKKHFHHSFARSRICSFRCESSAAFSIVRITDRRRFRSPCIHPIFIDRLKKIYNMLAN